MSEEIMYRSNVNITAELFIDRLKRLTFDDRRPVNDRDRFQTMLVLLAVPAAENYYPKIGMEQFKHCFIGKIKI